MEVDGAVVGHTVAEDMRLEVDGHAAGMVVVMPEVVTAEDMAVDTVVDIMTAVMEVEEGEEEEEEEEVVVVMRLFHQMTSPIRRLPVVIHLLLFSCRMFVVIVMRWLIWSVALVYE